MLPVQKSDECDDSTAHRNIRPVDQEEGSSERNDDSSGTCSTFPHSSLTQVSGNGQSGNRIPAGGGNDNTNVTLGDSSVANGSQLSDTAKNSSKSSSSSDVKTEISNISSSVVGASSVTSSIIGPSIQPTATTTTTGTTTTTTQQQLNALVNLGDGSPPSSLAVVSGTSGHQSYSQQQQAHESSSLSHSSSSDSSSRRTLLPSIKLPGGTTLIGSSSSSPSSVSSQQLDGFTCPGGKTTTTVTTPTTGSITTTGGAISPVTVSVTEVLLNEDVEVKNVNINTKITSSTSSKEKFGKTDKKLSTSSSNFTPRPCGSISSPSRSSPSASGSHDTPRGYSIKGEHYKNRFKGHIPGEFEWCFFISFILSFFRKKKRKIFSFFSFCPLVIFLSFFST